MRRENPLNFYEFCLKMIKILVLTSVAATICCIPVTGFGIRSNSLKSIASPSTMVYSKTARSIRASLYIMSSNSLVGFQKFKRTNPLSDRFSSRSFHHVEFYTGEAIATYSRFIYSMGFDLVSKSDFSTGNDKHASYMVQSGDIRMMFTSLYGGEMNWIHNSHHRTASGAVTLPGLDPDLVTDFTVTHGLGVRAIGIEVDNVDEAYNSMITAGARSVLSPTTIDDKYNRGRARLAEISLYGDTVLRLVNTDSFKGSFLPNFEDRIDVKTKKVGRYGVKRFDHIVGNVWKLAQTVQYIQKITVSTYSN